MEVLALGLTPDELATLAAAMRRVHGLDGSPVAVSPNELGRYADEPAVLVSKGSQIAAVAAALPPLRPAALWHLALTPAEAELPAGADDAVESPHTAARIAARLAVGWRAVGRGVHEAKDTLPGQFAALVEDLTPAHHAELLEEATSVAMAAGDATAAIAGVLERVAETLRVRRVSLWRLHRVPLRIVCVAAYTPGSPVDLCGAEFVARDHPRYFQALDASPLIVAHDARTDPRTRDFTADYLEPAGITAMLDARVFAGDGLAGVICIEHTGTRRHWLDAEQRFALSAAQLLSLLLEVDERRRAQRDRAETEVRFSRFLSSTRDLLWSVSADGLWTFANDPAAERLFGRPARALIGTPFVEAGGSTNRHLLLTWIVRLLNSEDPPPLELVYRCADGSRVPLRFQGTALHDARGEVYGATGTALEIVDLGAPANAPGRFRPLLDNAAEALLVVSVAEAVVVDANTTAAEWLAHPAEPLLGRTVFSLGLLDVHDLMQWLEYISRVEQGRREPLPVVWLTRADGGALAAEVSITLHPVDGEDLAVVVLRDVTERRRREAELQLFRFAVDAAAEAMFRVGPDGRILDCNTTACVRLGYAPGELPPLSLWDIDEALSEATWPDFWASLKTSGRRTVTTRHRARDGKLCPVEAAFAMFTYEGAQYLCAFVRDITARLEAEQEISRRDARLHEVIGSIPGVVYQFRLDADGSAYFTFLSDRAQDMLEIAPVSGGEIAVPFERVSDEDRDSLVASIGRAAANHSPWDAEFRIRMSDGTFRWVRGDARPGSVGAHGGKLWNGLFTDITTRKQLESKLQLASNLAAVGTLAAGVAHEINNPLSYLIGNISYVADLLQLPASERPGPEPGDLVRALNEALDGGRRVASIVADLKAFSRTDDRPAQPMELAQVLDVALRMTANQMRFRATLADHRGPMPPVFGQEGRLSQVFINLLMNALEAMPAGRDPALNRIELRTRVSGDFVRVEVVDNGEGMSRETLARAFDPFFTTKPPGVGTGLGLSVVHGIVQALGGEIALDSALGRGTRVTVSLRVAGRIPTGHTPVPGASGSGTRRRVLFIDDDPLVLKAVARLVGREHEVITFSEARAAIARLRQGERFDLIVSDLMMPDCSGADLHAVVAREFPEMLPRLYLMTGGAFTESTQAFAATLGDHLLDKAADLPRLRELVLMLT